MLLPVKVVCSRARCCIIPTKNLAHIVIDTLHHVIELKNFCKEAVLFAVFHGK